MSLAGTASTFLWIILILVIAIILIFVLFKLLDRLFLAPLAYSVMSDQENVYDNNESTTMFHPLSTSSSTLTITPSLYLT